MEDEHWDEPTCLTMIQRGGAHGERAVAVLYRRYKAPLCKGLYGRFSTLIQEEVEDRVHDAFVSFIQDIKNRTMRKTVLAVDSLRAWLWTITTRKVLDFLGSAAYRTRHHEPLDNPEGNQPMAYETTAAPNQGPDDGTIDCVSRAWQAFAAQENQRAAALRLHIVEGGSMQELATAFHKTEHAMRQYLYDCRQKFRPYLERWCGDHPATASGR